MIGAEVKRRRSQLLKSLPANAVALVAAAPERIRNRDVHHPYRQGSDFAYLTGFPETDALAVFVPKRKEGELVFFCLPRDPEKEQWNGNRAGIEGATALYGADQAHPIDELDQHLPKLLEGRERVYYPLGEDEALDRRVMGWVAEVRRKVRGGVRAPQELIALGKLLHEQRLVKSAAEIKRMRKAARISAEAHRHLMRTCRPGLFEYQLEAELLHYCGRRGGRFQAYPPIIGGGANACVLHYVDNARVLADGDLVLIDAGCEYEGYASDITRTFPVNGRFTPPQRALYELVLAAQRAAIAKAVPGCRWNEPHDAAVRVLTRGLVDLGLLEGTRKDVPKLIKDEKYKPFYMHRTGHWLGMDVHDVGDYKVAGEWRELRPGMVLTVEPGLYIPGDKPEVPEAYRQIGIRIEDDVLVTAEGNEVLSAGAPKTVEEIEATMAR